MTRVVFFDIGNTLVHRPTIGPGKRLAEALGLSREAARTITQLVFREAVASPADLAARLRRLLDVERVLESVVTEVWEAQEREPVELPGAPACVEAVAAAGARVGVISNIWAPYATGFRRACPSIVPRLESWHLSYQVGVSKPDRRLYEIALEACAVRPEDAVMVGDSVDKDIAPAAALGMGAIWVPFPLRDDACGEQPVLPAGAARVRDLDEARMLLVAALRDRGGPRAYLSRVPPRAIEAASPGDA